MHTISIPYENNAQFPAITDSLSAYIRAVSSIPLLSVEEERQLTERLHKHNDTAAARKLALSNLRLVVSVARGYSGYGLDQTDLIQEGNIGLLRAIRKFDPSRGVRLATFAVYWIRAEMHEFIIRNWRIVKIATTKAQRKLFFNMRRLTAIATGRRTDSEQVAKELGVTVKEVDDMRNRLAGTDTVALSTLEEDSPGAEAVVADSSAIAIDPEDALELSDKSRLLAAALNKIKGRERDIFVARRLSDPPQTLQSLAVAHKVSVERVRQIEMATFKKLAQLVKPQAIAAAKTT